MRRSAASGGTVRSRQPTPNQTGIGRWMGSEEQEAERPRHLVHLDGFYIDKYETTNALYKRFTEATGRSAPSAWTNNDFNGATQPVVGISWEDANAYCTWAGKRLPTEAEWEKAARGTDGRTYPWGDRRDASRANSSESKVGKTQPVGAYASGVSPYGAHDMAGNVWEWVGDRYAKDYYQRSPDRNPRGPESGERRVLRGGLWADASTGSLWAPNRGNNLPRNRSFYIGVRCARASP